MSMYGLPPLVVHLLRTMEQHKDNLKWNISHSSQKISLTLTWSLGKTKDGLLQKLHKTIKAARGGLSRDGVEDRPPLLHSQSFCGSPVSGGGGIRGSYNKLNHSRTLDGPVPQVSPLIRPASLHGSPSRSTLTRAQKVKAWAASRLSWPGSPIHPRYSPQACSTPIRSSPAHSISPARLSVSPSHSDDYASFNRANKVRISYRTDEEWETSLKQSLDIVQERTRRKRDLLKQEFDDTVKDWKLQQRNLPALLNSSTESIDSYLTEPRDNIKDTNQTVQNCLQSCENILERYSTTIW